jgi:hypothetical protein
MSEIDDFAFPTTGELPLARAGSWPSAPGGRTRRRRYRGLGRDA